MTISLRAAIVGSILIGVIAAGCQGTPVASPSPSLAASTATPTSAPTPSKTYGPNATAALTVVQAYYDWINTHSKDPANANFVALNRIADGEALSSGVSTVNLMVRAGQHQVGDVVLAQMIPDSDSPTLIAVTVCVDISKATVLNKDGQPVRRSDGLTRVAAFPKVENRGGSWFVISARGGNTSC